MSSARTRERARVRAICRTRHVTYAVAVRLDRAALARAAAHGVPYAVALAEVTAEVGE